jgi:hypothetical protein
VPQAAPTYLSPPVRDGPQKKVAKDPKLQTLIRNEEHQEINTRILHFSLQQDSNRLSLLVVAGMPITEIGARWTR